MKKLLVVSVVLGLFSCKGKENKKNIDHKEYTAETTREDNSKFENSTKQIEITNKQKNPTVEQQKDVYENNDVNSANVIEIFNKFKKVEHISDYQIKRENGNWKIVSSDETSSIMESTIDVKNGYISLSDGYTGGGSISYQFVLFNGLNKESIIAVSKSTYFDGDLSSTYSFWKKINLEWTEITNKVLPKFNYTNFFKNSNQKYIKDFENDFIFNIELPQFGTTSKVSCYIPAYIKSQYCGDPNDKKEICQQRKKAIQDIFYSLELKWDKSKNKFFLGKILKKGNK